MPKYKVVFTIGYEIEANNETEAIEKAEQEFAEEIDELDAGLTEVFNVNTEKL